MADLLLELFSEEIPARMQPRAEEDLSILLTLLLINTGIKSHPINTYCTPRRLTAHVSELPLALPDINEERRGPKVSAPEQAVQGFSRGIGVDPKDLIQKDGYYYARIEQKGAATVDVLAKALPNLIAKFPFKNPMTAETATFGGIEQTR